MINYTTSTTKSDLSGILELQQANLARGLTADESRSQGFVTVTHSYDELKALNDIEKHIIAKDGEKVIAYVLAMTQLSKSDLPVLIAMFDMFGKIFYGSKTISEYNYIVVGQVCVDKDYRGQGIFEKCYTEYKNCFKDKYDFAITEIASANLRSINAHKKIGFEEISKYTGPDKIEWSIVLLNWGKFK